MIDGSAAPPDPLARARQEAARYGGDDWVFVRELLQNARDAGARRVEWRVEHADGVERLICRDDGEGMTLEHARRYLFTLYASSKRSSAGAAGRFGIGFWSVLRFAPTRLAVRSRAAAGVGWCAELSGRFEGARLGPAAVPVGTEVILERPSSGLDLAARVAAAVRTDAPFLRCRDQPGRAVEVVVDSRPVRSELELPPPSVCFVHRRLRGAVGLGTSPEVRLYAHGLRVRTAAHLDELLAREAGGGAPGEVEGLMPRILLDSERIEVLMARGDARDDRELERLVATGRAELDRFLRRELDRVAPRGVLRRVAEGPRRGPFAAGRRRRAAVAVAAAALAVLAGAMAWRAWEPGAAAGGPGESRAFGGPAGHRRDARPYSGLGDYPGATVEPLAEAVAVDLRFRPGAARPHFAVLRLDGLDADGRPRSGGGGPLVLDDGPPCPVGCLEVELELSAAAGAVTLPEPTGGRIDPGSVVLGGRSLTLWRNHRGEAVLVLGEPTAGTLSYRVDEAAAAAPPPAAGGGWAAPPPGLAADIAVLGALPAAARPGHVVRVLAGRLRYDRSPATAAALRPQPGGAASLVERALGLGAGDCDVVAAVAGTMLAATGMPVRLAIGWVGSEGRADGGLHAWLEVAVDGRWRVLDPSAALPRAASSPAQPPPGGAPGAARPTAPDPGPAPAQAVRAASTAAILLLVVLAAWGVVRWRRESRVARRRVGVATVDLAELLRGVLQRPDAFTGAGDLEGRPLVPALGGGRLSLRRARRLAGRGELVAGRRSDDLVARVVAAGGKVVDLDDGAGRAVADPLGAHDLGLWARRMTELRRDEATAAVEAALGRTGRRLAVAVVAGLGPPGVVLRGPAAKLVAGRDLVALDPGGGPRSPARRRSPEVAALALADAAADLLELDEGDRRSLLAALAEAAVAAAGEPR